MNRGFSYFTTDYEKGIGNLLLDVSQLAPCAQEIININGLM